MYKNTDEIFVVFPKNQYIAPFHMRGPLTTPRKCTLADVYTCICSGVEVHQYDPATKTSIKLTATNIYDDTKFAKVNPDTGRERTPLDNFKEAAPTTVTKGVKKTETKKVETPATVVKETPKVEEVKEPEVIMPEEEAGELDDESKEAAVETEVVDVKVDAPVEEEVKEEKSSKK